MKSAIIMKKIYFQTFSLFKMKKMKKKFITYYLIILAVIVLTIPNLLSIYNYFKVNYLVIICILLLIGFLVNFILNRKQ